MDNKKLRVELRQERRSLSPNLQKSHSAAICQQLWQHPWLKAATHIGLYLPNDGEPDVAGLIDLATPRNKFWYLPCLDTYGQKSMVFRPWTPGDSMKINRFGIPEPQRDKSIPIWALSVVLVPLVAFDIFGNRLGMGAGYYDRTFIVRRGNSNLLPRLIGIGHDFQEVGPLEPEPWDVPMDLIVTNNRVITPKR